MKQAFGPADILLPRNKVNMQTWSVVACDQYTSEPQYWENVEKLVGNHPSTYNMILPEAFLGEVNVEEARVNIEEHMYRYMRGTLQEYKDAMIYIERTYSNGAKQRGLVGCMDLEQYDYHKGSGSLLRATEATVEERLPSRIRIREQAPLELPHILVLIDDIEKNVIEPLQEKKDYMEKVYDFDLMMDGGHITGWLLREEDQRQAERALAYLGRQDVFAGKYDATDKPVLEYAIGDGNHSLAAAKAYYEQLKAENPGEDLSDHPARYALVELENLHSPALQFEAIHRILKNVNVDYLLDSLKEELGVIDSKKWVNSDTELQMVEAVIKGRREKMYFTRPTSKLTVGSLQNFLDEYLAHNKGEIDYVHGKDVLHNLSMEKDSVGFILPDMPKEKLYPTVIFEGALPRKTFSMGRAQDKRYYLECRKIKE